MIACLPTALNAMDWADILAVVAMGMASLTLFGIGHGPLQHLHPAHAAPDNAQKLVDPQMIDERSLGFDHVADGHYGETCPIRLAGLWVGRSRSGASLAAADEIRANHAVFVCVECFCPARSYYPTSLVWDHRACTYPPHAQSPERA